MGDREDAVVLEAHEGSFQGRRLAAQLHQQFGA
jgi:hypothetical protein